MLTYFLPLSFSQKADLNSLPKLPYEVDPVHPTGEHLAGGIDVSGDGYVGLSVRITGFAGGLRHAAERDWKEYASVKTIAPNAVEFVVPGALDFQESVLKVSDCGGACGLVAAGAYPAKDIPSRLLMHFMGQTLESPRVSSIIKGKLRTDINIDLVFNSVEFTYAPYCDLDHR